MRVLGQIYERVVSVRNSLYDRQVFKARRLNWPVVVHFRSGTVVLGAGGPGAAQGRAAR